MLSLLQMVLLTATLFFGGAALSSPQDAGTPGIVDDTVQKAWAEALKGLQPKPAADQPELAPLQPQSPPELAPLTPLTWTGQVTLTWKLIVTPPEEKQETEHAINWSMPRPGKGLTRSTFRESTDCRAVVNLVPAADSTGYANTVGTIAYEYSQTTDSFAAQPIYCRTPGGIKNGEVTRTGTYKIYTVNEDRGQGKAKRNLVGGDGHARVEWQPGGWVLHLSVKDVEVDAELYSLWDTKSSCDPPKKNEEPVKPLKEPMTIKSIPFEQDFPTGEKNAKATKLTGSKNFPLKDAKGNPYIATVKWDLAYGQAQGKR